MNIEVILYVLSISYVVFTSGLLYFWNKIKYYQVIKSEPQNFLTVIIPIRNEADNILNLLQDLELQEYPKHLFEVMVIDDESSDGSPELVKSFHCNYNLKLISLSKKNTNSPKKEAIAMGISLSKGKLIFTTDGDCRVGKKWLTTYENFYVCKNPKFIFGGVTFNGEQSVFEKMQTLEFASLTGSGASFLKLGFPNMCNGANLMYEKSAFLEVKGYEGYDHIPSGDDEFLMHKIYNLYPEKVHFLKNSEIIVSTKAKSDLFQFYNQRKRWAGKWKYYMFSNIKYIAMYIFACNFLLIASLVFTTFHVISLYSFLTIIIIKLLPDYIFLNTVLKFYEKKISLIIFLLTSLFYPFYVSFFAISSNIGKYSWKGRSFK